MVYAIPKMNLISPEELIGIPATVTINWQQKEERLLFDIMREYLGYRKVVIGDEKHFKLETFDDNKDRRKVLYRNRYIGYIDRHFDGKEFECCFIQLNTQYGL